MYVVVEAQRAGQHKFVYCKVLRVRNMRYYFNKNISPHVFGWSGPGTMKKVSVECMHGTK